MFEYIHIYGFSPKNKESFKRFYNLLRVNNFIYYNQDTYRNILRQKTYLTYFTFRIYTELNEVSLRRRRFSVSSDRPKYVKEMIASCDKSLSICTIHIREINLKVGESFHECLSRLVNQKHLALIKYYRSQGFVDER